MEVCRRALLDPLVGDREALRREARSFMEYLRDSSPGHESEAEKLEAVIDPKTEPMLCFKTVQISLRRVQRQGQTSSLKFWVLRLESDSN